MTVPALEPVKNHYGNGSNTQFDFNFYIENEYQLAVYKTNTSNVETKLVNGIDYSINETENPKGSYITFPLQGSTHKILQEGEVLSIQLALPIEQETEYDTSSKLNLPAIEYSFDYLTRILQMLSRRIDRAVKVTEGAEMTADDLVNSIYAAQENTKMNADSARNTAQDAYLALNTTNDILSSIQELALKIQEENLNQTFFTTHNLFAIEELDKKLSEKELIGYGVQGETYSHSYYPDAYLELANDYEKGVKKIFTTEDVEIYSKHYLGDITGDFYIALDTSLEVGQKIYSDIEATESIGAISEFEQVFANSYIGDLNNFYIPLGQSLEGGIEVYSDEALINSLGTINDIKKITGLKYSSSLTGDFYTENKTLAKGVKIYSDEALSKQIGILTKVAKTYADRYTLANYGDVYVPQSSIINVGSKIYSDILCSKEIGEVTQKGTMANSVSYKYCSRWLQGSGTLKKYYYYTTRPLDGKWQWAYSNSACTQKFIWNSTGANSGYNGKAILVGLDGELSVWCTVNDKKYSFSQMSNGKAVLLSEQAITSQNYICINDDKQQLLYSKLGTDSIEVITVNAGKNETYELSGAYEKEFIKIGDFDYQAFEKDGQIEATKIKLENGTFERITDKGIVSVIGISFEYSQAEDLHKIVDSKYKNIMATFLENFGSSPYYIIDRKNKTFTLPVKDTNKNLYFCIGNTKIKSAYIDILQMIYDKLDRANNVLLDVLGE